MAIIAKCCYCHDLHSRWNYFGPEPFSARCEKCLNTMMKTDVKLCFHCAIMIKSDYCVECEGPTAV